MTKDIDSNRVLTRSEREERVLDLSLFASISLEISLYIEFLKSFLDLERSYHQVIEL